MITSSNILEFIYSGAIISTPDKKLFISWGKLKRHSVIDPKIPFAIYSPDFFLKEEKPWITYEHTAEISADELRSLLVPLHRKISGRCWINPFKDLFRNTFMGIQKKIQIGELKKAVPFVYEISKTEMSSYQLISSLMNVLDYIPLYPIYLYGRWNNKEGFLGATPEILFSLSMIENQWLLKTSALAGTKEIHGKIPEKRHLHKIQLEHQWVIEGIQESLACYGHAKTGSLEELKLPHLTHLKTPITLEMKQCPSVEQIIAHLHPTPALGAFPRQAGIRWLKDYQKVLERHYFGAPIGYVKPRENLVNIYVAIRNYQWNRSLLQIGAGCGVVMGSEFNEEWHEINLKLKSIKNLFSL